jgi:16S rRNA (cytidine1402-2'-O)-methyltransferase
MSGILYIVATPIGNLGDITKRAIETLELVDFVLAEDTRVTHKLLQHISLKKRVFIYTDHSPPSQEDKIIEELKSGKNCALVTDAGTPGISDPGEKLIDRVLEAQIQVVPVSGPSAVATLMSVFGKPYPAYHFWGFFPSKRKKQRELMEYFDSIPGVHVFFESPFRVIKTLEKFFIDKEMFHMVIGREMTKMHETYYRGTPQEAYEQLKQDKVKGEFCIGIVKLKEKK